MTGSYDYIGPDGVKYQVPLSIVNLSRLSKLSKLSNFHLSTVPPITPVLPGTLISTELSEAADTSVTHQSYNICNG